METKSVAADWDPRAQVPVVSINSARYGKLYRFASRALLDERPGHLLDAGDIVNDAFVQLLGAAEPLQIHDETHLMALAARAMRRSLVDRARAARAKKANAGTRVHVEFDLADDSPDLTLKLVIAQMLNRLAGQSSRQYHIVRLRFFAGLSLEETAAALKISVRTVKRDWARARDWLFSAISREAFPPARRTTNGNLRCRPID